MGFELGTSGFRDPHSYPLGHRAPLGGLGLRVRVKFSLGVRVSGMVRVRVDVAVRVRVSNLLGSV